MPELTLDIGDRKFTVSCQAGEELHLKTAAKMLDAEAQVVNDSVGRVPESRMLLMAGLMLADKTAAAGDQGKYADEKIESLEAKLREAESKALSLQKDLDAARSAPPPAAEAPMAQIEDLDIDALASVAQDLETLADDLEARINA